jgi:parallel beta-helix repeat protein
MPLTSDQKNCEECLGCVRVSAPTVITKPGCYYVTRNITTASGPVITIRANDVSLDVKGHTLEQGAHSAPVILIEPGSTGVAVFNGTLTGGKPAVSLQSTGPKSRLHFRNLTVKDYRALGFDLKGLDQLDLVECRVISGSDHGVMAFASQTPGQGTFSGQFLGNTFRCANSNILSLNGARGTIIRGNHLTGEADQFGIHVDGPANLIEGNTIAAVHGTGIFVQGNGNLVAGNTVNQCGISGIRVIDDDNRIAGNVVQNCRESGIQVRGTRNLIEGNQASEQQQGFGLEFFGGAIGNAYRNNMLLGNPGGAIGGGPGNTDAGGNIV